LKAFDFAGDFEGCFAFVALPADLAEFLETAADFADFLDFPEVAFEAFEEAEDFPAFLTAGPDADLLFWDFRFVLDFDVLRVFEGLEAEDLALDLPWSPDFEILAGEAFVPLREVLALVLDSFFEDAPLEDGEDFTAATRFPDFVPFVEETLDVEWRWPLRELAGEETFREFLE
jgi:hypothetical protein